MRVNKKRVVLVVPAYNEQEILEKSIEKLYNHFLNNTHEKWDIIIVDNASTDCTPEIADKLAKKYSNVKSVHLEFKGRGNALKHIWSRYNADVYAYCDIDLATDISHLKELFDEILNGYNVVTGSRYIKGAKPKRKIKRLILSKCYNSLVRLFFRTKLHDFQCGFKAIDKKIVKTILPKIRNKEWFFDTELLLAAEHEGYSIKEIPVRWKESKGSKVDIFKTSTGYIINLMKLKRHLDD